MKLDLAAKPAGPLSKLGLAVILVTAALDQVTKLAADALIPVDARIELLPILTLYRVDNTGIALSFLAGGGGALVALMLAVTAVVLVMWHRAGDGGWLATVGFALIVGGALGNLADRLRLGHVVDFLFLHLGRHPLFVFNLADVALTLGPAALLVVYLLPVIRRG